MSETFKKRENLICPIHKQKVSKVEAQLDIGPAKIDVVWVVFNCRCVSYATGGEFNSGTFAADGKILDDTGFQHCSLNPLIGGAE